MTAYIAFGSAPVGKALFLALFEQARSIDLVGHSRNADEAIAQIRREKPQLVIVEEILTHGWGMDVVESLGDHKGTRALVMISTAPLPREPQVYREQNIDLWLQFPQDYEQLRSALHQLSKNDPVGAIAAWREKLLEVVSAHDRPANPGRAVDE